MTPGAISAFLAASARPSVFAWRQRVLGGARAVARSVGWRHAACVRCSTLAISGDTLCVSYASGTLHVLSICIEPAFTTLVCVAGATWCPQINSDRGLGVKSPMCAPGTACGRAWEHHSSPELAVLLRSRLRTHATADTTYLGTQVTKDGNYRTRHSAPHGTRPVGRVPTHDGRTAASPVAGSGRQGRRGRTVLQYGRPSCRRGGGGTGGDVCARAHGAR